MIMCTWFSGFSRHQLSSTDKTVRVWDIGRRECVYKAEQHNDQVWGVAFSPSGSLLASVGDDKSIQFYQVKA